MKHSIPTWQWKRQVEKWTKIIQLTETGYYKEAFKKLETKCYYCDKFTDQPRKRRCDGCPIGGCGVGSPYDNVWEYLYNKMKNEILYVTKRVALSSAKKILRIIKGDNK